MQREHFAVENAPPKGLPRPSASLVLDASDAVSCGPYDEPAQRAASTSWMIASARRSTCGSEGLERMAEGFTTGNGKYAARMTD